MRASTVRVSLRSSRLRRTVAGASDSRPSNPTRCGRRLRKWVTLWDRCVAERWVHPLVGHAASSLDFLCIHPFRDGNGRVSRLLWLLQSYRLGYEVGRYISVERLVEGIRIATTRRSN